MKYKVDFLREAVLLIIAMFLMCITNSYGYKIPIIDSIKGIGLLCVIAWLGVCLGKFMNTFVKLPIFLYLSVMAMFLASPVSPIAEDVYSIASKVEFAGKILILALAIPILMAVLNSILQIL